MSLRTIAGCGLSFLGGVLVGVIFIPFSWTLAYETAQIAKKLTGLSRQVLGPIPLFICWGLAGMACYGLWHLARRTLLASSRRVLVRLFRTKCGLSRDVTGKESDEHPIKEGARLAEARSSKFWVASVLVGLAAGLLMLPLVWPLYFCAWLATLGFAMDPNRHWEGLGRLAFDFGDLNFGHQIGPVILYFTCWGAASGLCYVLVLTTRKVRWRLFHKPCGLASASPSRRWRDVIVAVLLLVVIAGGGTLMWSWAGDSQRHGPKSAQNGTLRKRTRFSLIHLAMSMDDLRARSLYNGDKQIHFPRIDFPQGGTRGLWQWLKRENEPSRKQCRMSAAAFADEEGGTMRDWWGHELVYRYPSKRFTWMFELYSVGPNGIDEGGGGDDIGVDSLLEDHERSYREQVAPLLQGEPSR